MLLSNTLPSTAKKHLECDNIAISPTLQLCQGIRSYGNLHMLDHSSSSTHDIAFAAVAGSDPEDALEDFGQD